MTAASRTPEIRSGPVPPPRPAATAVVLSAALTLAGATAAGAQVSPPPDSSPAADSLRTRDLAADSLRPDTLRPATLRTSDLAPDSVAGAPDPATPAPSPWPGRPRVGLVLGGGGARGAAHVGVLRVLEEARVPVDLVVGTSMGAVVGALYAAGLSPAEMEAWLAAFDWDEMFSDAPPYAELSFRRKARERNYPIGLELGVDADGIRLPPGLVAGQKLTTTLRHLLLPAAAVRDFDDLAIPLRVVATDLATGEAVVLRDGDLVGAIRASMSAPGVFTPYPMEGRLLGDGGLTRNLPVDVARAMGAEVIIAVDVGTPLSRQDQLRTVVALTRQVATLLTQSGSEAQRRLLGPADILIRPDLEGHGATEFAATPEIAVHGELAARTARSRLAGLAVPASSYGEWRDTLRSFDTLPDRVDYVVLESRGRPVGKMIRRLEARAGPLDTVAIRNDLRELYSHGIYEAVDYQILDSPDGAMLLYSTREKAWGPNYMRFRIGVADDLEGGGTYNLATHLLVPKLNAWDAELVVETELGSQRRAAVELFQPLGLRSQVFVAPYVDYTRAPADLFAGGRAVARIAVEAGLAGLAAGRHFGNDGELRLGTEHGRIRTEPLTGPPEVQPTDTRVGGVFAELAVDGMDDPFFPRRGYVASGRIEAERRWLGGEADYQRLTGQLTGVTGLGSSRLLLGLAGATSLDSTLPWYRRIGPGGPLVLSGYAPGEVSGNHMLLARSILYTEIRHGLFLAASLEAGNAWEARADVDPRRLRFGSTLSLAARTPLGPAYLGYGFGEGGRRTGFLGIGRGL